MGLMTTSHPPTGQGGSPILLTTTTEGPGHSLIQIRASRWQNQV